MKMADGLIEQQKYYAAINILEEVVKKDPNNKYAIKSLAELHEELGMMKEAASYYWDLFQIAGNEFPKAQFKYAQLIKYEGRYQESIDEMNKFIKEYRGFDRSDYNRLVKAEIEGSELAMKEGLNAEIRVYPLDSVNKAYNELAPTVFEDKFIWSTIPTDSSITYLEYEDSLPKIQTYYRTLSEMGKDTFSLFLPEIINEEGYHVSNLAFSTDGRRIYFTRCSENLKGKMICAIYASKKEKNGWSPAIKLDSKINDINQEYSVTHPTLTTEDRRGNDVLIYASNQPGGQGGYDLYSVNIDSNFNVDKTKNLGGRINSGGNEITPYYDNGKELLYFSSNGLASFGGYDIYKSEDKGRGRFNEPKHLMQPVNSSYDDIYYTKGNAPFDYFVSNRQGSKKYQGMQVLDDIYVAEDVGKRYLKVLVYNKDSLDAPLKGALVRIKNPDEPEADGITVNSGDVFQIVPKRNYLLVAQKNNFLNASVDFSISYETKEDTVTWKFMLERISKKEIKVDNIYFENNSFEFLPSSKASLEELYRILIDNPDLIIQINAHTDNVGSNDYNQELSQKRAQAVIDFLIKKGIGKNRLVAKGFGQTQPVGDNDTEEGRQLNRRITFQIIGSLQQSKKN
jgi:outer membrane protein OmpA-like peptidoglycan-associated protein